MNRYSPIYVRSREEAAARWESHSWQKNHAENILCAQDMEQAARSPEPLPDTIGVVLEKWGVNRVRLVLANTLRETPDYAGLNASLTRWCLDTRMPDEADGTKDFVADISQKSLDVFLAATHSAFEKYGLFDHTHCDPHIDDYLGCVLALHPDAVQSIGSERTDQLWLAVNGWDCEPGKNGSGISAVNLAAPELGAVRIARSEFMGALRDEYVPDWALEVVKTLPAVRLPEDRELARRIGAYNTTYCEANSQTELDYTDKVLVLPIRNLPRDCQQPAYQLWYADYGMGCSPGFDKSVVRAICLIDGSKAGWNRSDFIGVLKEEHLPNWAVEELAELRDHNLKLTANSALSVHQEPESQDPAPLPYRQEMQL